MKERPILFNGEMVKALLDGRKTQTRRIVKNAPHSDTPGFSRGFDAYEVDVSDPNICGPRDLRWGFNVEDERPVVCPYGQPGDTLWVRETFALNWLWFQERGMAIDTNEPEVLYRADPEHCEILKLRGMKWKPSIFMPRWASRTQPVITNIRVERVQDISEEDAIAEGVYTDDMRPEEHDYRENWGMCPKCAGTGLHNGLGPNMGVIFDIDCIKCVTHKQRFKHLWDSINLERGYGWEKNPLNWVIGFEVL